MGIHAQTQEKVAIKILEKNKIADVADVERVTREIKILKQVRHPNIIQLYEIIENSKQLFLVMEYVSEGELFELIVKKKRLKEHEACRFFQQIIAGVEYLHELGIVHRDLKPENLLIDFNQRLKFVDFGLSNTYKQSRFSLTVGELLKTACGSPCYAAPEMIAGKRYEPLPTDIWSCGIILYAMVCGYLPFEDPNTSALYKKIIGGDFHIPKFVSPSVRNLIQGILTTDPNRRFTIRAIKNHEWFRTAENKEFYDEGRIPMGIKVNSQMIPFDEEILEEMKEYEGVNQEEMRKFISNNRHNHTISIYYLLMKKNLRLGRHSIFDICSRNFDSSLLTLRSSEPQQSKEETEREERRRESVELDRTTTATGNRSTSRAVNRIHFMRETRNNNFVFKKKEESVELKLDLDNLPIVDNAAVSTTRRRFNVPKKTKKEEIHNLYLEQNFRTTQYAVAYKSNRPSVQHNPVSFRNSITSRQEKSRHNDRYNSLDVPETSVSN